MIRNLSTIAAMCCLLPLSTYANTQQLAIGNYVSTATPQHAPLLALSNQSDNAWTYRSMPDLPKGYRGSYVGEISCNSTICTAVGAYNTPNGHTPLLAMSFNQGNQWTYVPKFDDKNAGSELYSTSCNNTLCVVVGDDRQKDSDKSLPLLSVSHGNQWDIPVINNAPSDFVDGGFGSVVCDNSFCMAAGEYYTANNTRLPLVAVSYDKDKMNWTYSPGITTYLPKGATHAYEHGLYCNDKACIISGSYNVSPDKQVPLIAISNDKGNTWSYATDVISKLPATHESRLDKVKCNQNVCVAAGYYRPDQQDQKHKTINYYPLVAVSHDTGKTWSYITNLTSKLPEGLTNGEFWDVGCNEKVCLAAGQYTVDNQGSQPFLMYTKDQGETWAMLNDLPKDYGKWGNYTGVHCNNTACFATGGYQTNTQHYVPLLVTTQDGNTWSYPVSVIANLPQDFLYGDFNSMASHSYGLKAHKKVRI